MRYENIITKEYINENVRPFSGNDTIFNSCVKETINFDLNERISNKQFLKNLLCDLDGLSEEEREKYETYLNNGLRDSISYFVYSRAIRTSQGTITKYGYTQKNNDESFPIDNEKIVSDSSYFKTLGEKYLKIFMGNFSNEIQGGGNGSNQYLNFKIVGK